MDDRTIALPWVLERHAGLGAVTEVRVFRRTGSGERSVYSGIFGPAVADVLMAALRPVTPHPRRRIPPNDHPREWEASFHFSLNGVNPALAEGRWGRLERARDTVRDSDICVTSLFLIDVDPERPSHTSATDNEKELAFEVAESIADWLSHRGVSTIRADSGNGYHLLVPLVPFRGEGIRSAARDGRDLLKLLDERFTRPGTVKVDTGNFNPSRLSKLYGTPAVKGTHSKERPHRYSSIDLSSIPPDIDLFSVLRDEIEGFRARNVRGGKGGFGRTTDGIAFGRNDGSFPGCNDCRVTGCDDGSAPDRNDGSAPGRNDGRVPGCDNDNAFDRHGNLEAGPNDGGGGPENGGAGRAEAGRSTGRSVQQAASRQGRRRRAQLRPDPFAWKQWRADALAALPLDAVFGDLLTGKVNNDGWLECRDPSSRTGDRNPSAGVADGSGSAERGSFHSFISGDTLSVFDFLVQQGQTGDFRTACAWVADRSGVALPGRLQDLPESMRGSLPDGSSNGMRNGIRNGQTDGPQSGDPPDGWCDQGDEPFDLDQVDTFLKAFRAEEDRKRKPELMRGFLVQLVQAPMLEQHIALEEIHRNTGYPLPALRRTLADLQRDELCDELDDPPDDVPVLDLVRGQEAISALFKRLVAFLRPLERFYSRQATVLFLQRGLPPLMVTEGNLSGLLAGTVEFRMFQRSGGQRQLVGYEPLPPHLCKAFVNSPRVRQLLPPLATYSQAPFFSADWSFIARPGYYPVDGGVYYDGPEVKPRRRRTDALDALTRGSFWKEPTDRINFLGALLTGLTLSRWTNGHGVIMVNGNRTGIGKSILVQAIALVTDGRKAPSITFGLDQNEFEKQMATQVDQGGRIIFIDNIKLRWPVESAVLERTVTDWVPNFRRLGSNSSITRDQNDLLACLTMNRAMLGADMRRRVLPINLHVEGPKVAHKDAVPDPKTWLLKHRLDLVAELAGMVMVWLEAGRPMDQATATHTTSHEWASTIDAILRANGFEGFLSNYDASMGAFDPDYQLMVEICRAHRGLNPQTATGWVDVLRNGPLEDRFKDRHGQPKSVHAQTQIVARLFNAYREMPLEVDGEAHFLVRSEPDGPTHSPQFCFQKVEE